MRICNTINSNQQKYCLSQSKYFNSIEELVQNYQHYSLRENFERLKENTMLEWPYRQIIAVVLEDFEPHDRSQLRLRVGDQIIVIGKEGYREGWWKAKSKNGVSQQFEMFLLYISLFGIFAYLSFENLELEKFYVLICLDWLLSKALCPRRTRNST